MTDPTPAAQADSPGAPANAGSPFQRRTFLRAALGGAAALGAGSFLAACGSDSSSSSSGGGGGNAGGNPATVRL